MSEHTPGPWRTDAHKQYVMTENTYHPPINDGANPETDGRTRIYIASIVVEVSSEERKANANLIAAAPELLEVLQLLIDARDNNGVICPSGALIAQCKEVIAKATGKSL